MQHELAARFRSIIDVFEDILQVPFIEGFDSDDARVQEGQKAIYHLEAFVAKFMSEYKSWSIMMLG